MQPTWKTNNPLSYLLFGIAGVLLVIGFACEAVKKATGDVAKQHVGSENVSNIEKGAELVKGIADVINACSDMSIEDERGLGESIAVQAYATPNFGTPIRHKELMLFMNCMANVIGQNSNRPMIPYHVAVVKSDELNAVSAPGGYIILTSGLVLAMENEAELAFVIGHEIAHITQKHAVQELQKGQRSQKAIALATKGVQFTANNFLASDENFAAFEGMVKDLATSIVGHSYDVSVEIEADTLGAQYAMDTGYDPTAIRGVLQKLKPKETSAGSTHPTIEQRLQKAEVWLEQWKKEGKLEGLVKETERLAQVKAWVQSGGEEWK